MTDSTLLMKETEFFDTHREEFARKYAGRFLLIKGEKLIGSYSTRDRAVTEGVKRYGQGPFLVRAPEEDTPVFSVPALALGILQVSTAEHAHT